MRTLILALMFTAGSASAQSYLPDYEPDYEPDWKPRLSDDSLVSNRVLVPDLKNDESVTVVEREVPDIWRRAAGESGATKKVTKIYRQNDKIDLIEEVFGY